MQDAGRTMQMQMQMQYTVCSMQEVGGGKFRPVMVSAVVEPGGVGCKV